MVSHAPLAVAVEQGPEHKRGQQVQVAQPEVEGVATGPHSLPDKEVLGEGRLLLAVPGISPDGTSVYHASLGTEENGPAPFAKAPAEVELFAVEEIIIVEVADFVDDLAADQQERSLNSIGRVGSALLLTGCIRQFLRQSVRGQIAQQWWRLPL